MGQQRQHHTEELDALVPGLFVLRALVTGEPLAHPVEGCRLDLNNVFAVQTTDNGQLSSTQEKTCRQQLAKGDRVLLGVLDRVEVERERLS